MAGIGLGGSSGGVCLHRALQFLPTIPMAPFFAKPSLGKRSPVPGMRVTMMLPKFSPAKILENIIFSLRFKTPEDKTETPVQPSVANGNGVDTEVTGNVETQLKEQEQLIETIKEESRKAGIEESTEPLAEGEETADITRDTLNPSILWERREKDVLAEQDLKFTSPGFSFSAAGLLFPYHLGVCQCLIQEGYITENTPLAGSSAGALVCAVVGGGLSMYDALQATKELALDCRTYGTAFRLGAVLRNFLEKFLPEDVHLKVNGKIRVAVTQVFRSPRGLLVDYFESREDLINALLTSCFIPGYLAPRPVTIFRNRICVDGGITLFMPPTAADKTVRVCAFPLYAPEGISPDLNPAETRAGMRQLFNWALEPAEDVILDQLFELGFQDAMAWVKKQDEPKQNLNGGTNGGTNGAPSGVANGGTNGASSASELK
ncbi:hypothetical protein M758_3G097200 [Ceratodon purpureus]|uniref:Patatin n=1 Tax=Ceratodon purpureus TaxID=3225 RepID=A0A8T0IJA5_CERPU|nr:hypothetical protein KC19_3G094200 [Ceratodon purpureus]KAG0622434.1 hypothetical protein M758_3G097200 [Ceratodon purpureus]